MVDLQSLVSALSKTPSSSRTAFGPELQFSVVVPDQDLEKIGKSNLGVGIHLYSLSEFARLYILERDPFGNTSAVIQPSVFLGAVYTSDQGKASLAPLGADLRLFSGILNYEEHLLTAPFAFSAISWLCSRMIEFSCHVLADSAALRRALGVLRSEHEEVLSNFAILEAASTLVTPRRTKKLEYPPSKQSITLHGVSSDDSAVYSQRLPMSTLGTAAISLRALGAQIHSSAYLKVDFKVLGRPHISKSWRYFPVNHEVGEITFRFDRATLETGLEAILELSLVGDYKDELTLALSFPSPLREYCLQTKEGVAVGAPLAVAAWGFPPGLTVSARIASDAITVLDAPHEGHKFSSVQELFSVALSADELEDVRRLAPHQSLPSFDVVQFRPDRLDVLVHPVGQHTTVAAVSNLRHRHIKSLLALVLLDNIEASPVECGLAIVPHRELYKNPEELIQSWSTVHPLIYTEISGTVTADISGPVDLLLATRMAGGASDHLAWATFKRIEIVV